LTTRRAALAASLLLLAAAAAPARGFEFRAFADADVLVVSAPLDGATTPGGRVDDLELGYQLRVDLRNALKRVDFRIDFLGRTGFTGQATENELRELSATVRGVAGRLDISLGRIKTPGGFWLLADGLMLTARYTSWLGQSIYGGLRSFTTGRKENDLTQDPTPLGVVGTSLFAHHRLVDASITFTWAQDLVDFPSGMSAAGGPVLERHKEPEYFLDAQASVRPADSVWIAAGASLGTRYDVQFAAQNPYAPVDLGVATLGAVSAWALAEWRPRPALRLAYSFNFERVRVIQSELPATTITGAAAQAATGDFEDHLVRGTWIFWRALRAELRYRLRFRANTDVEHHLAASVRGDELWRGFGLFASIALDHIQPAHLADAPDATHLTRLLYEGGLSFVRPYLDARAGVLYTEGVGTGLLSTPVAAAGPNQLFPYVIDANQVAFLRLFVTPWRRLFAGVDVEENLNVAQVRALVQIGAAL
jgi:hypothetical protein